MLLEGILGKINMSRDRVDYQKLHKYKDVAYEMEVQKQNIESERSKLLNTVENDKEILLVYRIIYADNDNDEDDYSVFLRIKVISSKGVRYPEPRLEAVYLEEEARIDIGDIRIRGANLNRGYGSALLEEMLKISKKLNVKKITGYISSVDWDHIDRLKHFYEKYGFVVELDLDRKQGSILYEQLQIDK